MKVNNCLVSVGEYAGGMCSVVLQHSGDKTTATLDATEGILNVWLSRLLHADKNRVKKVAQSSAIYELYMIELCSTNKVHLKPKEQ